MFMLLRRFFFVAQIISAAISEDVFLRRLHFDVLFYADDMSIPLSTRAFASSLLIRGKRRAAHAFDEALLLLLVEEALCCRAVRVLCHAAQDDATPPLRRV